MCGRRYHCRRPLAAVYPPWLCDSHCEPCPDKQLKQKAWYEKEEKSLTNLNQWACVSDKQCICMYFIYVLLGYIALLRARQPFPGMTSHPTLIPLSDAGITSNTHSLEGPSDDYKPPLRYYNFQTHVQSQPAKANDNAGSVNFLHEECGSDK